MPLMTPGELAALRRDAESTLDGGSLVIQRKASGRSPIGGVAAGAYSTVATIASHSIGPVGGSPSERAIAAKVEAYQLATISLPAGTDVRHQDRIVIGAAVWEVAGIIGGHTDEILRRVVVARVADP